MNMALYWKGIDGDFNDILFEKLKLLEAPKEFDRRNVNFVKGILL